MQCPTSGPPSPPATSRPAFSSSPFFHAMLCPCHLALSGSLEAQEHANYEKGAYCVAFEPQIGPAEPRRVWAPPCAAQSHLPGLPCLCQGAFEEERFSAWWPKSKPGRAGVPASRWEQQGRAGAQELEGSQCRGSRQGHQGHQGLTECAPGHLSDFPPLLFSVHEEGREGPQQPRAALRATEPAWGSTCQSLGRTCCCDRRGRGG